MVKLNAKPTGARQRAKATGRTAAKPTAKAGKATKPSKALALRGGRTLQVRTTGSSGRETIELKSRDGALELKITMTPDGPMIHVKGGSLAVEAADAVSVACKRFDVQASGGIRFAAGDVSVESGGEMRMRSQGPTHMDSEVLHLNCGDRSAYPPPPEFVMPEPVAQLPASAGATHNDGCGCDEHHH